MCRRFLSDKFRRSQAKAEKQRPGSAGKTHTLLQPVTGGGRMGARLSIAMDKVTDSRKSPSAVMKPGSKKLQRP